MNLLTTLLILVGFSAVLGLIFFGIGFFMTRRTKNWEQTTGTIIKKSKWAPDVPEYKPTFRFQAKDGRTYEVTSVVNQSPGFWPGSEVPIVYDPADPRRARIHTLGQSGRLFVIIGACLIGLAGLGLVGLWLVFPT